MITQSERAEIALCETGEFDLATVLHALSDPIRLRIVSELACGGERSCGAFKLPITKSTSSHHFRVLREAGVISTRVEGKSRINVLRRGELDARFPGLLDAILHAQA
ncbi:MAG TPA: metalloregulator ArsR/SmtB family transcription factor [Solirubrobacteraceae bacterium]|nr:metalloregulator ArsR/SmtB family transcription factor [Solirubrobacteraceae bacterium]